MCKFHSSRLAIKLVRQYPSNGTPILGSGGCHSDKYRRQAFLGFEVFGHPFADLRMLHMTGLITHLKKGAESKIGSQGTAWPSSGYDHVLTRSTTALAVRSRAEARKGVEEWQEFRDIYSSPRPSSDECRQDISNLLWRSSLIPSSR